jgi:hypothetical protein
MYARPVACGRCTPSGQQHVDPLGRGFCGQTPPRSPISSGFEVEPIVTTHGRDSERRPTMLSPRTPDGPSDTLSAGTPTQATAGRARHRR